MSTGGVPVLEALERAAKLMSPPFPLDEKDPPEVHAYYAPAALLRELREAGEEIIRQACRIAQQSPPPLWAVRDALGVYPDELAALLSPAAGPTERKGNDGD